MALLPTVLAILTAGALAAEPPRPNLTEWEAGKAAEAAAEGAEVAKEKKMSAVGKAVEMLESLQAQVLQEGEAEVATYNKFACFCKDTTTEKIAAIQKGEDSKTELTAYIEQKQSERGQHDTTIQEKEGEIAGHKKDQNEADDERAATKKLYDTNAADLKAALDALDGAIDTLKSSKRPSFAQIQSVSQTVRTAALLADALGVGGSVAGKAAAMFLQQPANEVQMQDYDFHSDDIISTLEKLLDDFRGEKGEVDEAEVESIRTYDNFTQFKTHAVKMANEVIDKTKKARSDAIDEIQTNSQQLSTVEATLLEDKEYANKLSQMCTDKAKTWDQRSQARAAEIATLTQAIGIIKGAVSNKTTAATIRFAQQGMSVRLAKMVAIDPAAMSAIEADAEATEAGGAVSLVQRAQKPSHSAAFLAKARRLRGPSEADSKAAIVKMLKGKGMELRSTLLTSLATQLANDPFAKVKTLIQELIERLLQEAANEANQKGWCDKAMSDAKQKRDYAAEEIAGLNSEMAKLEARKDDLNEALDVLAKDIQELKDNRAQAVAERAEEKAENENTVGEAQEGLDALNMCIDLLDKFYKTQKKNTVDLSLAQAPEDDAPDAGFGNGEAYTGAQSESGGILGMLDVMKSDFVRTIEETQIAEQQAEKDHLEFMTETGKSLAQKEQAETERTAQLQDAEGKFDEAEDSLGAETQKLQTALSELMELKPTCIDTGMSYEDRVGMREDEIEALKKALCILGKFAEYGPDGAADAC